jgi:hypothetical protein
MLKMKPSLKITFYGMSALVSILLITFSSNSDEYKDSFLSLGSAILGAVFSLMFAEITSVDVVAHIYKRLSDNFGLQSDEVDIDSYRIKLYHYHVTQLNGKKIWRYRIYDFAGPSGTGRLTTTIIATDRNGKPHYYDATAGIRNDRFILIEKSRTSVREPPTIEIYPHMGIGCLGVFAGIGVMQTWDGPHFITRCLFSNSPLLNLQAEGDVPTKEAADLDSLWKLSLINQGDHVEL